MFLWVQEILLVVSETPANISIICTLQTATAGKVYLCCLFQGRILLPAQNEDSEVESSMENEGRSWEG